MTQSQDDHWSSEAYQSAASFVPKLAVKVMQWLDPQPDDVILDIGCGDGVLDIEIDKVLSQGQGKLYGTDSSPSMIESAKKAAMAAGAEHCDFYLLDALDLVKSQQFQQEKFTKAFSNAAMHWILRPEPGRETFFRGVRDALAPGGTFAFEMGGLGNVHEMRGALLMGVARRIGLEKAVEADPWFFPDEQWITEMMEKTVGGWKIEKIEREYRPTPADKGGVEGWVRLMGKQFFDAVPGDQREECIREVVDVLEVVCRNPSGGYVYGYVRLRVLARKI